MGFYRFYVSLWKWLFLDSVHIYCLLQHFLPFSSTHLHFSFQPNNMAGVGYVLWKWVKDHVLGKSRCIMEFCNMFLIIFSAGFKSEISYWYEFDESQIFLEMVRIFSLFFFFWDSHRTRNKLLYCTLENQHTPSEVYDYWGKYILGKVIHSVSSLNDQ